MRWSLIIRVLSPGSDSVFLMLNILRKPSSYLLILVLLVAVWGIYHAARMGVADVVAHKSEFAVGRWDEEKRMPTSDEVEKAVADARSALSWEPRNPDYHDLLAQVLIYKGLVHWADGSFNEITDESLGLYRRSVELRPRWPYAWARFAMVKAYRGEYDAEFENAVAKAAQYGPWDPGIHVILAEAGMYGWGKLSIDTRKLMAANLHRGLTFEFSSMKSIVRRYNRMILVCGYLPGDKRTTKFCGW